MQNQTNILPENYTGYILIAIPAKTAILLNIISNCISEDYDPYSLDSKSLNGFSLNISFLNGTNILSDKCQDVRSIPIIGVHDSVNITFDIRNVKGFGTELSIAYSVIDNQFTPQQMDKAMLNCSVPYFSHFAPALSCNFNVECDKGQDEEDCFYEV